MSLMATILVGPCLRLSPQVRGWERVNFGPWLSLLGRDETLLGFWMMLEVAYCSICVGHQIQLAMKLVP